MLTTRPQREREGGGGGEEKEGRGREGERGGRREREKERERGGVGGGASMLTCLANIKENLDSSLSNLEHSVILETKATDSQ